MSENGFKNKVEGNIDKVKGKAKETWGKITDDKETEFEGKKDQVKGEIKKKIGEVKDALNDDEE